MFDTLARLQSHRTWYVPDVDVIGELQAEPIDVLAAEWDDGFPRIVYYRFVVGGEEQLLNFADLIDHRGNNLPASIDKPIVVPIAKTDVAVAIVGTPTSNAFRIAKLESTTSPGVVDLLILEMRE